MTEELRNDNVAQQELDCRAKRIAELEARLAKAEATLEAAGRYIDAIEINQRWANLGGGSNRISNYEMGRFKEAYHFTRKVAREACND